MAWMWSGWFAATKFQLLLACGWVVVRVYGLVLVLGSGLVLSVPVEVNSCLRVVVGGWDVVVVRSVAGMRVRLVVVVACIVVGSVDMGVECGVAAGVDANSTSVVTVAFVGVVFVIVVVVVGRVLVHYVMDVVVVVFWFH